jgi:hypothetical protein
MEKRFVSALAVIVLLAAQHALAEAPVIVLTPSEWDFGTIDAGSRAFLTLRVANHGDRAVTVSVLPDCDCLSTGPSRRVIAAGSQGEFRFSILAEDDESGVVRETYLFQTDLPGLDHFFYSVHGVVKGAAQKPSR